jgi:hypothetical protein
MQSHPGILIREDRNFHQSDLGRPCVPTGGDWKGSDTVLGHCSFSSRPISTPNLLIFFSNLTIPFLSSHHLRLTAIIRKPRLSSAAYHPWPSLPLAPHSVKLFHSQLAGAWFRQSCAGYAGGCGGFLLAGKKDYRMRM